MEFSSFSSGKSEQSYWLRVGGVSALYNLPLWPPSLVLSYLILLSLVVSVAAELAWIASCFANISIVSVFPRFCANYQLIC